MILSGRSKRLPLLAPVLCAFLCPLLVVTVSTGAPPPATAQESVGAVEEGGAEAGELGRIRSLLEAQDFEQALTLTRDQIAVAEDLDTRSLLVDELLRSLTGVRRMSEDPVDSLAVWSLQHKEARFGASSPQLAKTLLAYAGWLDIRGRYEEALARVDAAATIFEAEGDPHWRDLASALDLRMLVLEKTAQYDEAARSGERALALYEVHGEGDGRGAARVYGHLARTEEARGELVEARRLLLRTAEILDDSPEASAPERAVAHNNLSNILRQLDELDAATEQAHLALELYREGLGEEHPRVALAMGNLANVYMTQDRFDEAERWYQEGLELSERTLGPDHRQCAIFLYNLGRLQRALGDERAARESYARSKAIIVEKMGAQHDWVARLLTLEADSYLAEGRYALALEKAEEALELKRATLGEDHADLATSLDVVAKARIAMGDLEAADEALGEARELVVASLGTEHSEYARLLELEAELQSAQGAHARAAELREEAGRIRLAVDPSFTRFIAELQRQRALDLARSGRVGPALQLFEQTLDRQREALGSEHPSVASTLRSYAAVSSMNGDLETALGLLAEAERIYEAHYGEHPLLAETLFDRAVVEHRAGMPREAFESARRAEGISRRVVELALRGLGEREALLYAERERRFLDLLLSLGDSEDYVEEVWDAVAASRARVFDELARRYQLAQLSPDPELHETWDRLARARARLAQLYAQGPADRDENEYEAALRLARESKENAERELARTESARFPSRSELLAWGRIDERLGDGYALLAFTRYDRLPLDDPTLLLAASTSASGPSTAEQVAPSRYLAFLQSGAKARPLRIELGSAEKIDAAVTDWRESFLEAPNPLPHLAAVAEEELRRSGQALAALVLDPLPALDGLRRVFVIPDGSLHLVDLALLDRENSPPLMDSGPVLQLLTDEGELAESPAPTSGEGVLLVGDPEFDGDVGKIMILATAEGSPAEPIADPPRLRSSRPTCRAFEEMSFTPLPATERELESLHELFLANGEETMQLSGADANEASFKSKAPGHRVLHLATHAFYLGENCEGGDSELARAHPLLLSGLAMSGANHRSEVPLGSDDGILSAEEISSLDLSGTELAVLSACQTGGGAIQRGEGVLGLRRAFHLAGCRAVLLSLWPVEDEAAAEWMELFYAAHLEKGQDGAEAARSASRALRERRSERGESTHPFYWGAFVYAGAR